MENHNKIYIDGQWTASTSGEWLETINPATESLITRVPAGSVSDVDRAVQAAARAFDAWANTPASERRALLLRAADLMEARRDELLAAVSDSLGCPRHITGWLHVDGPIEAMRLFAEHTGITEETAEHGHSLVWREAVGVCGFINPWNYPLHQFVGKVGAALAAGCTMVVKPSEQTPLQDYLMAEIFHEAGLPAGVFNLVPGRGPVVGQALCEHPLVDMLSFTGSTRAGIEIAKACAPTVKRVTQELGGKSPYIITADSDFETAVRYGVDDVMINSGQTCTALTRMLVPQSRYDEALEIIRARVAEIEVGMGENAFMGPLSSRRQWQQVQDYIRIGIDEGATLVCGGLGNPQGLALGFYARPTVFAQVNNEMRIAREEIFGPVLCVIAYEDLDQAVAIANDTPYGLSSGVYAKDHKDALAIARRIRAGLCFVNGGEFNYQAPFGGFKQSGNGREFSVHGVEEFTEIKSAQLGVHAE
ncbi:aldehyde dehydrogenase family protein [Microbulbifer bruguierae]|uniref:Aldehyde dehydrogenase family protein n=1 Tax=Microbulbifer bruguierae TaxID=3029061 RepID=A0ABY8NB65_9GAMM|nr:aldehyde dehydrogenase family protein [Microbulbifer bruguierae]WGL15322.1 aldehyde dehydrogenase family protein [Microbulbifer bruguierae]